MITNASPFYVCLAQTTTPALVCTVEMQHLSVAAATVEWMGRADPTVQIAQVVNAGSTEVLRYAVVPSLWGSLCILLLLLLQQVNIYMCVLLSNSTSTT